MEIFGFTLHTLGELLVAFTVIKVHHRVLHEHKIDKKVFLDMKMEQKIGVAGMLFILLGFTLQIIG